jgi:hypothetical protein
LHQVFATSVRVPAVSHISTYVVRLLEFTSLTAARKTPQLSRSHALLYERLLPYSSRAEVRLGKAFLAAFSPPDLHLRSCHSVLPLCTHHLRCRAFLCRLGLESASRCFREVRGVSRDRYRVSWLMRAAAHRSEQSWLLLLRAGSGLQGGDRTLQTCRGDGKHVQRHINTQVMEEECEKSSCATSPERARPDAAG